MRKTVSNKENKLIYEDFEHAKKQMCVKKIAFNLAQQEYDDFGWHLHGQQYWEATATVLYDEAKKRNFV